MLAHPRDCDPGALNCTDDGLKCRVCAREQRVILFPTNDTEDALASSRGYHLGITNRRLRAQKARPSVTCIDKQSSGNFPPPVRAPKAKARRPIAVGSKVEFLRDFGPFAKGKRGMVRSASKGLFTVQKLGRYGETVKTRAFNLRVVTKSKAR